MALMFREAIEKWKNAEKTDAWTSVIKSCDRDFPMDRNVVHYPAFFIIEEYHFYSRDTKHDYY
jgi:hypothetical protein